MAENNPDASMAAVESAPIQKAPQPDLDWAYEDLRDEVRMVCRDYSNLLLVEAKGGIGKTYNITETLQEEREAGYIENFQSITGKITPLELYKKMFRVSGPNDILFLDDVRSVVKNRDNVEFLKAATDSNEENWISYNTSAESSLEYNDGTRCPPQYNFEGRIIICCNDLSDNEDINALVDRGTDFTLSFDHDERLDLIREVAKVEREGVSYEERRMIADFIAENTMPGDEPSLRTLDKCLKKYEFSRDFNKNWEEKCIQEIGGLNGDKKLARDIRIQLFDEGADRQVKAWQHLTGKSRATYYNVLSDMPHVT